MAVAAASPAKALARDRVKGLWIAIPTPFTADGRQVDEDVLAASVEHYVAGVRVDGIFCGGVMGEFWALSLDGGGGCTRPWYARSPAASR
jgi:4-hydroxy-tetrahydrodipicolinate synthase